MNKIILFFENLLLRLRYCYYRQLFGTVGKGCVFHGRVFVRGNPKNIRIGENVTFEPHVWIWILENGQVFIDDNTYIGRCTKLISIKSIEIGKNTLLAADCFLQDCSHGIKQGQLIRTQPLRVGAIRIGSDVWLGTKTVVLENLRIGDGAVIGAHSLVRKSIAPNAVAAGIPVKLIKMRETEDAKCKQVEMENFLSVK